MLIRRRLLIILGTAGALSGGLALGAPLTAHAQNGPCGDVQAFVAPGVTGTHHAFDDSSGNCVGFLNNNNSAFLKDDSNDNFIVFYGAGNAVDELRHSSDNGLFFYGNGNTVSGTNVNDTGLFLDGSSDVVTASGVFASDIEIDGSNDFLVFNSGCDFSSQDVTGSNLGSASSPLIVC